MMDARVRSRDSGVGEQSDERGMRVTVKVSPSPHRPYALRDIPVCHDSRIEENTDISFWDYPCFFLS